MKCVVSGMEMDWIISTIAFRVVGIENENPCLGEKLNQPVSRVYTSVSQAPWVGEVSNLMKAKYGHESRGTRTRARLTW
jgi:hypothetical protein